MKRYLKNIKEVLFTVTYICSLYSLSAIIVKIFNLSKTNTVLYIDHLYPTIPFFIFPYIMYYIYITLGPIYIGQKNETTLHKYTTDVIIITTTCFIIYLIYPTYIDRSGLISNDSLLFTLFTQIREKIDVTCNALPSLHAAISWLIHLRINELNVHKKYIIISLITSISICLATFIIRQHGIIDTITAVILAELIHYITNNYNLDKKLFQCITKENKAYSYKSSNHT